MLHKYMLMHCIATYQHAKEVFAKKVQEEEVTEKEKERKLERLEASLSEASRRRHEHLDEKSEAAQLSSSHKEAVDERRRSLEIEEEQKAEMLGRRLSVEPEKSVGEGFRSSVSSENIALVKERRESLEDETLEHLKQILSEEEHALLKAHERRSASFESLVAQAQASNHSEAATAKRERLEELFSERNTIVAQIQEKRQALASLLHEQNVRQVKDKAAVFAVERVSKVKTSKESLDDLREHDAEDKLNKLKLSLVEASKRRESLEVAIREKAAKMSAGVSLHR
jgi:hypothetical protein